MNGNSIRHSVPYFSQWESASMVVDFIAGAKQSDEDPQWASSGATSIQEYAKWASHVCGMACFKMIIAARTGRIVPTLHLTKQSIPYGAYVEDGDDIRGLIYAPFVAFIKEKFGIKSSVVTDISAANLPEVMSRSEFFMASVSPGIRWPERTPEKKGGHLVLITAADRDRVTFHNPSGHDERAQVNATASLEVFDRYFAGRGIAILGELGQ